ncbi:DUF4440 domain-containing protein [Alkalicoccus luteus]|uniref:DUF4440 domain-containing protein n=1 Tax=Alkalicoccus luteus TaxID=1237094 RepID=A0A969TUN6_9BACI|nr:DUF4440 domain-containing protein [Alkalicoccus luteus]NJP37525.1 DUF4440 domain-containing protein [Alkalicoccus luteus]
MNVQLSAHIRELEETHIRPDVRRDMKQLGELLADSFIEIGSSGRKYGKREVMESGVHETEMTIHDYQVRKLAENTVLAVYYLVDHTQLKQTYRSSIWSKIEGRWQLAFHQGTPSASHKAD